MGVPSCRPLRWVGVALISLLLAACGTPAPATGVAHEPSPTPCEASLRVISTPSDATVFFDDEERGRTPLTLQTTAQQGTLRLEKQGFKSTVVIVVPQCARELVVSRSLRDVASPQVVLDSVPATLSPGDELEIAARAQDNDAVVEMALYLDGESLHEVADSSLHYGVDTSSLSAGEHAFSVEAVDGAGNRGSAQGGFQLSIPTATREPRTTATASRTRRPKVAVTATPKPRTRAVSLRWDEVTIDTYGYEEALYAAPEDAGHPYPLLDGDRVGPPRPRTYRVLVMRNEYLELTLLPALGGRVYQCRFLPTGQDLFYNNQVIKPTHWGPADQGWWLAVGGMEFCLPVDEHGYVTAEPWAAEIDRHADGSATVTMYIQEQSRHIEARVSITLRPQRANFAVHSALRNVGSSEQGFQYWINAMLAPGAHSVRPSLRFYYPASEVIVHSTGDASLPGTGETLTWPAYQGRDLSRYAQWRGWLGFFAPDLEVPFTAVYEPTTELGMVRVFPSQLARGVKLFGFAPQQKFAGVYTDDGSGYVEMWGGLTPTFWDYATLEPDQEVAYEEIWYPVAQCGGVSFANDQVALHAVGEGGDLKVSLFSPARRTGVLQIVQGQREIVEEPFTVYPEAPLGREFAALGNMEEPLTVHIIDRQGTLIASHALATLEE